MKYAIIALVVAVVGLIGLSTRPQETSATNPTKWPPLSTTCNDVTGDGTVDLLNDILGVILRHGTSYGGPPNEAGYEYALLYDVDGGGQIDLLGDVLSTVQAHGQTCSLVDTQVVQATVAVMKYQDQSVAIADGYVQVTQNLFGHGIHWLKGSLMDGVFDLTQPEGLNYSLDGELLAVYYIDPLWLPGHELPPPGFDTDEDMWHDHPGLCFWQGTSGPMVNEGVAEQDCLSLTGGVWFESFGWMLHIWNFLPNAAGRFTMHNDTAG